MGNIIYLISKKCSLKISKLKGVLPFIHYQQYPFFFFAKYTSLHGHPHFVNKLYLTCELYLDRLRLRFIFHFQANRHPTLCYRLVFFHPYFLIFKGLKNIYGSRFFSIYFFEGFIFSSRNQGEVLCILKYNCISFSTEYSLF